MSPIPRNAIKFAQRIKNSTLRNKTLDLVEEATKQKDLSAFTKAEVKNPAHTSHSDSKEHATVRLATEAQAAAKKAQTLHIYFDKDGKYSGHELYGERENKSSDE